MIHRASLALDNKYMDGESKQTAACVQILIVGG